MKRRHTALWGVLVSALCAAGCNGGGGTQSVGPPAALLKNGGDGQGWFFNNPLPTTLSVTAVDIDGRPVPGVTVVWAAADGGGAVNPTSSITNGNGIATTTDSIGSSTLQHVTATFTGLPGPATFTESATIPPTSGAVGVMNNFFSPDSSVVQAGSNVTWTWGGTQHTLTFTSGPPPLPAETIQSSGTKTITFTAVGSYRYKCTIHANMNGTLVVVH